MSILTSWVWTLDAFPALSVAKYLTVVFALIEKAAV